MEQDVMNVMLNGGSNALFATFLYWQYIEQRKRSDAREKRQEVREKDLRDRYDKVIQQLQEREDKMRGEIVQDLTDLDKRMSLLEQKLEHINKIVEEIKIKVLRLL